MWHRRKNFHFRELVVDRVSFFGWCQNIESPFSHFKKKIPLGKSPDVSRGVFFPGGRILPREYFRNTSSSYLLRTDRLSCLSNNALSQRGLLRDESTRLIIKAAISSSLILHSTGFLSLAPIDQLSLTMAKSTRPAATKAKKATAGKAKTRSDRTSISSQKQEVASTGRTISIEACKQVRIPAIKCEPEKISIGKMPVVPLWS